MLASHITLATLERAAAGINAELFNLSSLSENRHRFRVVPERPDYCEETHTPGGRKCYRILDRICVSSQHYAVIATHRKRCPQCKRETEPRVFKQWRTSVGWGRQGHRIRALCWHGFRDFFRLCYREEPDAIFRTGLDTWRGRADFESRFEASGWKNIGPQIAPVSWNEACECSEGGYSPKLDYSLYDTHTPCSLSSQICTLKIDEELAAVLAISAGALPSCPDCRSAIRFIKRTKEKVAIDAARRDRERKRLFFRGATGRQVMRSR